MTAQAQTQELSKAFAHLNEIVMIACCKILNSFSNILSEER